MLPVPRDGGAAVRTDPSFAPDLLQLPRHLGLLEEKWFRALCCSQACPPRCMLQPPGMGALKTPIPVPKDPSCNNVRQWGTSSQSPK